MIKAFKRLFALLAGVLVIFGAIKSIFNWLARSENDDTKYGAMTKSEKTLK